MTDKGLYPYDITGRIIDLCILIYNLLDRPKDKRFETSRSKHSRNNQHYALICTTPLFYILAPTCFGSSLTSSGSFLDPSELFEIQIE
jgi:hypothetical protein